MQDGQTKAARQGTTKRRAHSKKSGVRQGGSKTDAYAGQNGQRHQQASTDKSWARANPGNGDTETAGRVATGVNERQAGGRESKFAQRQAARGAWREFTLRAVGVPLAESR